MDAKLADLLKVSLKYSDPEELRKQAAVQAHQTDIKAYKTLTTEDQRFLESALEGDAPKMRRALQALQHAQADGEAKEAALEELQYFCESVDNAIDLEKMKGLPVVVAALEDAEPAVRTAAAGVLATALQHNPHVQKAAVALRLLPLLFGKLGSEASGDVRAKLVLAVSAMVRESDEAGLDFVASGGFPALARLFAAETDGRALRRGAFLAYALCSASKAYALRLIEAGAVPPLALLLRREDDGELRERVLQALDALAASGVAQEGIAELRAVERPPLGETLAAWRAAGRAEEGGLPPETEAAIGRLLAHLAAPS